MEVAAVRKWKGWLVAFAIAFVAAGVGVAVARSDGIVLGFVSALMTVLALDALTLLFIHIYKRLKGVIRRRTS